MQRDWVHQRQEQATTIPAAKFFPEVYRSLTGLDVSSDIERFVQRGEPILLPVDLYGACAVVETILEAGKHPFQKVVLTSGMTAEAREICQRAIGRL